MHYTFGDCVLDTQRAELHRAGVPIKLRRKVLQVLAYLLAHHDRVVSKRELLERLWPDQFVGDETLKSCMKTLRQALGDRGRPPRFLRTLHGQGYRFVAAVEVQESFPADAAPHSLVLPGEWDEMHRNGVATPEAPPSPGTPLPTEERVPREVQSPQARAPQGEHKQVTVLCGALAEAPALAARLGPEAMYHLMNGVLALAQETVQRYEGTMLQVSGEGFLALFGAPVAQEDHARRAVLAALDLSQHLHTPDAIRGQPYGVAVHLGLHTGPVVVGPLAYEPQRPYTAAGDTLYLAHRLQQQATPDTPLISAATYALVQDEVQGEAGEPLTLEAATAPVPVYAIRGLRRRRAGVPQRGTQPLSRFVGRARELDLLHERLAQAVSGQGQVVGIAGEAGLGKSRLLAEFAQSLHGQPVTYCEGHCLAYGSATPYLPVRDLLRQLWGLPDTAAHAVISASVHQQLRAAGIAAEAEPRLLLLLLDVPVESVSLDALSPPERKARTFAMLRHLIRHASQQQSLLLAIENLHWIDPTSEEWLASLVEGLGDTPVLLLATYRPGYQPPWLRHSAATQMALPRLTPRDSLALLQSMPQATQLPVSQQQAIVAKAAGNPFFVEELTWAAVTTEAHTGTLPLPDTIEAVLAARLDRLPLEAKRLVQTAAVIGPEVPVPLLQAIADLPEAAVQGALVQLQAAEFLYEAHCFPDHTYTFKHALTHEVAYGSLLQERQRVLHARTVEALEAIARERGVAQVEQLAHHALRGQVWDKAFTYCQQAGTKAVAVSAYREVVGYWEQALEALAHLPPDRPTLEQAIDLRCKLALAVRPFAQHAQALAYLRDAETLADALGDRRRLGRVCRYIGDNLRGLQDYEPALAYSQRAYAIVTALGDVQFQILVSQDLGYIYYDLGDYRAAMHYLQQSLTTIQGMPPGQSFSTILIGPEIQVPAMMTQCLSELGTFAAGMAYGNAALQSAEANGRPYACLTVYWHVGALHVRQGTLHQAIPLLERAVIMSQEADIPFLYRPTAAYLALAYALAGRTLDALPLLEQMGRNTRSHSLLAGGEAYLRLGDVAAAEQLAQQVLAAAGQRHMRGQEAWARWLLSEIARQGDPPDVTQAEALAQQALALATERGMRPLAAHCHLGLGTLYATTGRREQARTALTTAIELYRAMDMTFWLPQAEAALAQVESR